MDDEIGDSTKRSMTTKEGDYSVQSNIEASNSGGLTIRHTMSRDATKKKKKMTSLLMKLLCVCNVYFML